MAENRDADIDHTYKEQAPSEIIRSTVERDDESVIFSSSDESRSIESTRENNIEKINQSIQSHTIFFENLTHLTGGRAESRCNVDKTFAPIPQEINQEKTNTSLDVDLNVDDLGEHNQINRIGVESTLDNSSKKRKYSAMVETIEDIVLRERNEMRCSKIGKNTESAKTNDKECEHTKVSIQEMVTLIDDSLTTNVSEFKRNTVKQKEKKPSRKSKRSRKVTNVIQNTMRFPRNHARKRTFQCSNCYRKFSQKSEWQSHRKGCRRSFECYLCKYSTKNKTHLLSHIRIHTGGTPFTCTVCEKVFTIKYNMTSHMIKWHNELFRFKCSICCQEFVQEQKWKSHEMICNRKRFNCHLCKYSSIYKKKMEKHIRTHTGKCIVCKRQFKNTANLTNHMKTHSNFVKFKCSICNQGFLQEQKWKTHEKNCNKK